MTSDERRERADRLCRILSERVAELVSVGLGHWDEAWELVEEPSGHFLDLLHAWEDCGDEGVSARARMRERYMMQPPVRVEFAAPTQRKHVGVLIRALYVGLRMRPRTWSPHGHGWIPISSTVPQGCRRRRSRRPARG